VRTTSGKKSPAKSSLEIRSDCNQDLPEVDHAPSFPEIRNFDFAYLKNSPAARKFAQIGAAQVQRRNPLAPSNVKPTVNLNSFFVVAAFPPSRFGHDDV
jgi:hypothetical protein